METLEIIATNIVRIIMGIALIIIVIFVFNYIKVMINEWGISYKTGTIPQQKLLSDNIYGWIDTDQIKGNSGSGYVCKDTGKDARTIFFYSCLSITAVCPHRTALICGSNYWMVDYSGSVFGPFQK